MPCVAATSTHDDTSWGQTHTHPSRSRPSDVCALRRPRCDYFRRSSYLILYVTWDCPDEPRGRVSCRLTVAAFPNTVLGTQVHENRQHQESISEVLRHTKTTKTRTTKSATRQATRPSNLGAELKANQAILRNGASLCPAQRGSDAINTSDGAKVDTAVVWGGLFERHSICPSTFEGARGSPVCLWRTAHTNTFISASTVACERTKTLEYVLYSVVVSKSHPKGHGNVTASAL